MVLRGKLEHTELKDDPLARLARTAGFVRATTYSAAPVAQRVIDTVNRLRGPVTGEVDGRPYTAADPDLINWVPVTIWGGFLDGYKRLSGRPLAVAARVPIWICANILLSVIAGMLPGWAAVELGVRPNRFLAACNTIGVKVVFACFDRLAGEPEHVLRARRRCLRAPDEVVPPAAA
ncbi:oxygenase MpaB family protein [Nocardia asteroides]|uniref:oxygenase MpaB family protein n=1 Tax=Nocardia asteroides TaxID=1824 RepID=UPI0037C78985